MADQTKLLKVLAERHPAALSLDAICQAFQPGAAFGPKSKLRKGVINGLGKLMQKHLVERPTRRRETFGGNGYVEYGCTAAGLQRATSGARIEGGVTGPRPFLPKPKADMRQRLWEALRIAKKITVRELVELVRVEGDVEAIKVIKNACQYFAALEQAGVVSKLAVRAKGFSPQSNGFVRYALVRDLGLIAPSAGKRFVTDHNARAAIPYKTESK